MKHIDIKVTVWNRLIIPDGINIEEAITFIKAFGMDFMLDEVNFMEKIETLWGTHKPMQPDKNTGLSTIKVYEDNILKWENGNCNR